MSNLCQICVEPINVSNRKSVKCPFCSFDACRTCCETYLLNESVPKCMNNVCDREWTPQFTRTAFTRIFLDKKYKCHREDVLFDQERALLPTTQPVVENTIRCENIDRRICEINALIITLRQERSNLALEKSRLLYNRQLAPAERREFIKGCPDTKCRGFLSTQWKCGLCEKWTCRECHEIKGRTNDAEHTCNPDTVASVALLTNDTKNCPKCQASIFKINGCDQMWCTQCHTAFNWRTGRLENSIHNPHYYEWLRRNGNNIPRQPGDIPCQNNLTHQQYSNIRHLLRSKHLQNVFSPFCENFLENVIRNTLHLRYITLGYQYREVDYAGRNLHLRISYMRNFITKEQFKVDLQRNEKRNRKTTEIRNILNILMTTVTEIIFRFWDHLNVAEHNMFVCDILEEIDVIVDYTNEVLLDISKTYGSKLIKYTNTIRGM